MKREVSSSPSNPPLLSNSENRYRPILNQLNFADILLQLNELETAAKRTESIHQRIIEELGKQSMRVSFSHVMLGKIYRRMKQCDKAKQHISQAHQIRSKLVEPDSIFIKETQEMLDQGCDSTS